MQVTKHRDTCSRQKAQLESRDLESLQYISPLARSSLTKLVLLRSSPVISSRPAQLSKKGPLSVYVCVIVFQ